MKPANTLLSGIGTTIFTVMSALAVEHNSINLGQGFPDTEGPADVVQAAADALKDGRNQYPPMPGVPELRQAVAAANRRFYGLEVDWASEVVVTSGATEAITACLMAVLNPGDEVVLIEPLYDTYLPVVRLLGAVPRLVRLEPPDWTLPRDALADAFGPKTKAILLNSPMNPAGKVFTAEELGFIAELVLRHDAYAICDEVYEHLTFDGARHIPLMTLPGMRDRTMRIGSAGQDLLADRLEGRLRHRAGGAGDQCGEGAPEPDLHDRAQPATCRRRRSGEERQPISPRCPAPCRPSATGWRRAWRSLGLTVLPTQGSYFISTDFRPLGFNGDDVAFCRHITEHAKVTAIPVSAFYDGPDAPSHYARFAFCKRDEVLDEAVARLRAHFGGGERAQAGTASASS